MAASKDDAGVVRSLIFGYEVDVEARMSNGRTPLQTAAYHDAKSVLSPLTDTKSPQPANVNAVDYQGCTALYYAVRRGNSGVARFLLNLNCMVNKREGKKGNTALHVAVYLANPVRNPSERIVKVEAAKKLVNLLIEHGADVAALNFLGETPMDFCPYRSSDLEVTRKRFERWRQLQSPLVPSSSVQMDDQTVVSDPASPSTDITKRQRPLRPSLSQKTDYSRGTSYSYAEPLRLSSISRIYEKQK